MSARTDRVAEAIKRLISEIVHSQLRDPRITGVVTITKVELTPDLRQAKIYYSVLGDEKKRRLVEHGLASAKGFIRKCIGNEIKLRYTPELSFRIDEGIEYSKHIDDILNRLNKEREDERNRKINKSN